MFAAVLLALSVPATVTSVYDGDTIKVEAAVWPGITWTGSVRVLGVDTPELRAKCPEEKAAAVEAREFVKRTVGYHVTLHNIKLGKFAGRVLADVQIHERDTSRSTDDLAELLIEQGHARPYDGGARAGWCESNSALLDELTVAYSELTSARLRLLADGKQNEAAEIQTHRETLRAEIDEALYGGK